MIARRSFLASMLAVAAAPAIVRAASLMPVRSVFMGASSAGLEVTAVDTVYPFRSMIQTFVKDELTGLWKTSGLVTTVHV